MAGITLSIVGALEDMECEGSGCPECEFNCLDAPDHACQTELPDEPVNLAYRLLSKMGGDTSRLERARSLGAEIDAGWIYPPHQLGDVAGAIRDATASLDEESQFNEFQLLRRALAVIERAKQLTRTVLVQS